MHDNNVRMIEYRRRLGWSQEKFGIAVGLTQCQVSLIESGKRRASHAVVRTAEILSLSLAVERQIIGPK